MSMNTSSAATEAPQFANFEECTEDLQRHILSFVADAPLEQKIPAVNGESVPLYAPAALTTSLPLVNRQFYKYSQEDFYWEPALKRQLQDKHSCHLWKGGLRRLLPSNFQVQEDTDLLQEVLSQVGTTMTYKQIYETIVKRHIRFEASIFIMPCHVKIGEIYGLHLFEPRYRIMVRELLDKCRNPREAGAGGEIEIGSQDGFLEPPLLIHACQGSRLGPGEMACLVEIVWCNTYEFGTADVQLLPVAWVRLDKLWVRPSSGHLFVAQASRI